jgi:Tfp pilus assembly ATPase PilU
MVEMDAEHILNDAVAQEASDIFIVAGQPITYSVHGLAFSSNPDVMAKKL